MNDEQATQALTEAAKPGYKTTELYVTVLSMVLTLLAVHGVISFAQINPLLQAFVAVYAGAVGALTIFGIARSYFQSRTSVKTKLLTTLSQGPVLPIDNSVKTGQ